MYVNVQMSLAQVTNKKDEFTKTWEFFPHGALLLHLWVKCAFRVEIYQQSLCSLIICPLAHVCGKTAQNFQSTSQQEGKSLNGFAESTTQRTQDTASVGSLCNAPSFLVAFQIKCHKQRTWHQEDLWRKTFVGISKTKPNNFQPLLYLSHKSENSGRLSRENTDSLPRVKKTFWKKLSWKYTQM